jgi:predicted small metal-binding protein
MNFRLRWMFILLAHQPKRELNFIGYPVPQRLMKKEVLIMEKVLRCQDVGPDCDYVMHGKTVEEIFEKASDHAKKVHHMKEMMDKALAAIYEEDETARPFVKG